MIKIITNLLVVGTIGLYAYALEEGIYLSDGCNVSIKVENRVHKSYYSLLDYNDSKQYEINVSKGEEGSYLIFTGLYKTYYGDADENSDASIQYGDKVGNTEAFLNNSKSFTIQNYGNAMNPYITFDGCDKYLEYMRLDSIQMLENRLKEARSVKKYNEDFIYELNNKLLIAPSNVERFNNVAYYLYKHQAYHEALILLRKILWYFPSRTVAHYNYAQSVEGLLKTDSNSDLNQEDVDKHYLSYMAQMMYEKKEGKIPKRYKQKYASFLAVLKELNGYIKEPYQVLGMAKGDLNDDNQDDLSLVIELVDGSKIAKDEQYGMRPENKNKRLWLVFFAENGNYTLVAQNSEFIEPDQYTNCDDNFDTIAIKNNSLFLHTHFWCSAGGWEMGGADYQIIYRDRKLILAGTEAWSTHRATGEGSKISSNYLTKKRKVQKTVDMGEVEGQPKWEEITEKVPIEFENISDLNRE